MRGVNLNETLLLLWHLLEVIDLSHRVCEPSVV